MSSFVHTTRFSRGKLPHWEVERGRYFVTFRCADSLPPVAVERLREIHDSLQAIEAQSEQYLALQRHYFLSLEKHLDAGNGACPLRDPRAAQIVVNEIRALAEWQVDAPHFSVMPNHCHVILEPRVACTHSLAEIMRRLKGRSSRAINALFRNSGAFWQREWFDRWMRHDAEHDKCVRYIQDNPVKAGLAGKIGEHQWTR